MGSPGNVAPLRLLVIIPGKPDDHSMVFSRRQAMAFASKPGVEVEVYFLQNRLSPTGIWASRKAFKKVVRRFMPNVVHAHYGTVTALFGVLFSPVPVVVTYHGSDLNSTPKDGFLRDLLGRCASQLAALGAAGIICVSEGLRRKLWWKRKAARIIPMGVELDRFVPIPHGEARQALGWAVRPWKIIFNGRDSAVKRFDIALAVEERLQALGIEAELEVLQGGVGQGEMPVLLSAADALLLCSDSEGSPTMVKEAMACNLPVVTSDVGDVRDRLADVRPGGIVSQNPDDLALALRAVLLDGRRSNGRDMAARNKVDAATLDALTLDLLYTFAR